MTTGEIQDLVLKLISGRYSLLLDDLTYLAGRENEMIAPGAFVCHVQMFWRDFVDFRRDCNAAGLDIIAVFRLGTKADASLSMTIIATDKL